MPATKRTEAAKLPRLLNARVCPLRSPPSGRDAKFGAIGASENCAKTAAYEKRTESAKSGAMEKNGQERMDLGRLASGAVNSFPERTAQFVAFFATSPGGENVSRGPAGGVRSQVRTLLRPNSLISRESAGNFREKRPESPLERLYAPVIAAVFGEFPTRRSSEFFSACREFLTTSSEFFVSVH